MAVTTTQVSNAWSLGPLKIELWNITLGNGDTSVVIASKSLNNIVWSGLHGAAATAVATSGGTVTYTVVDPTANRIGTVLLIGT